jgi:hypothetical protein
MRNRVVAIGETIGQQHDSNCEAIKTAIRSFERYLTVDAVPASAAQGFWKSVITQGFGSLTKLTPAGSLSSVFKSAHASSRTAASGLDTWKRDLAKKNYVQGLVDYWESYRAQLETYWNGEGSVGTQRLLRGASSMMPDSRESHVNQLIAGAQRFNKQDVDSVAFEKGLYSKWMEHNTAGRTRFKDEGLLTVQYKLNQDTRRFTFEHAWLKGPGSGGIVARMRDVDRKANSVADFRFEKAVRIVE